MSHIEEVTVGVLAERLKGLQQLTEAKFQLIERQLGQLTSALEKVISSAVNTAIIEKMEGRITDLEKQQQDTRSAMVILRLVASIGYAILIAILVALATNKAQIIWQ